MDSRNRSTTRGDRSRAKRSSGDRNRSIADRDRSSIDTNESDDCPSLIGHRGCAGEHPENTLAAIESAAEIVDAVEVDVRRCGSGELVVIHDAVLDRVTDANGPIEELDWTTIRSATVLDTDEPVPRLVDVFEAAPPSLRLVLELKEPGLAADAIALAREFDNEVLLSSFYREILKEVRSVDRSVPLAYTVRESRPNRFLRPAIPGPLGRLYFPENVDRIVDTAREFDCTAVHPRYELCLRTELVARAHTAGLRVEPWTIESIAEYEALARAGVDGVFTDVCSMFREV